MMRAAAPGGQRETCASMKPKEGFPSCSWEGHSLPVSGETGRTGIATTEPESEVWEGPKRAGLRSGRLLWPSQA